MLDRYLHPHLGDLAVGEVTPSRIDAVYATLRRCGGVRHQPLLAGTIARVHVMLRSAFAQAMRWGWTWDNPVERAYRIIATSAELRPPTPHELCRLLDHVRQRDDAMHAFLFLAALTGARRAQLLGLRWHNVHFDTNRVSFCAGWVIVHLGPERVRVEPSLPNGRVADAAAFLVDRWVWIEITALNTSDPEYEAEREFKSVRVGYGDPYHCARRFYRKAFDKIAGTPSDPRSQLHPTEPSVLVIADGATGIEYDSLGMEWAVTQILDPGTRTFGNDASLHGWLANDYPKAEDETISSIRHLSGIGILTYDLRLRSLAPNNDPDEQHAMLTDELAVIADVLGKRRPWCSEPANP